jgi:outer membrane lipoprotein-sorting protein
MRKISILMIVLLHSLAGALHAQGNAVLNSLYSKMSASCVSMDYSFTMNSSDVKVVGNGSVMVQDSAYSMTGNGLQIICDGKTVWIIDAESKEVMIESPSQGDEAYMDNPALLFVNLSDAFSVDGVKKNGSVSTYVMSPMVSCGIKAATLSVTSDPSPAISSAHFILSDGAEMDIKIKSMTFSEKKPLTSFFYDISGLDSSWVITDLR